MSSLVWPERPLGRPGAHGRRAGAGLSRRRAVHSEALMAEEGGTVENHGRGGKAVCAIGNGGWCARDIEENWPVGRPV
jgi:hypothetical protein